MPAGEVSDGPRRPKWHARRQEIVDTSARLFARRGYDATGMSELCAANGLGRGAFYHYIGSKEELLVAIHDRVMDEVLASADRVAGTEETPAAQLAQLGDELLEIIARYPDHVWVFLHEFPALTGERAEQFHRRRRDYERRVELVLQAGVDTGQFRTVDARLTALGWLGMHNYAYLWFKGDGPNTAGEVAQAFGDIFLRGIVTPQAAGRANGAARAKATKRATKSATAAKKATKATKATKARGRSKPPGQPAAKRRTRPAQGAE